MGGPVREDTMIFVRLVRRWEWAPVRTLYEGPWYDIRGREPWRSVTYKKVRYVKWYFLCIGLGIMTPLE